jgi:hypothetical protein
MHFVCVFCDRNVRAALRKYQCQYPVWRQPNRCIFAMAHYSLSETGAFMPQVPVGCGRHNVHNDEVLREAVCANPSTSIQVTYKTSLRFQFGVHCLRGSCILSLFMFNLYMGYNQGTIIFTSSSISSFYTKL